jgi:biotin carboxyl carrier protein
MTFEIEIGGRTWTVSVERADAGRYRIAVDGQTHVVDAARIGEYGLSLVIDGDGARSREVHVAPAGPAGTQLVHLDGRSLSVSVNGRRTRRRSGDGGSHAAGEATVAAPMPGRVVRVLVGPGDEVKARQPVVVVEAMKMENELRSPKAGVVKEVSVSAGTSVEAGRSLVVIT